MQGAICWPLHLIPLGVVTGATTLLDQTWGPQKQLPSQTHALDGHLRRIELIAGHMVLLRPQPTAVVISQGTKPTSCKTPASRY